MSVNKAILIGNLGAKPEIKYLPSGQAVCEMRLATNEKWKDKDGAKQERTEWHRVVVWGKTAENCAQYLDKGRQVYVEGRITTRTWDDKTTGEKKYMTEIVATNVTFLAGGGRGDDSEASGGERTSKPTSKPKSERNDGGSGSDFGPPPGEDLDGNDIPF